jgi:uncharacterized membrane protein YcfT
MSISTFGKPIAAADSPPTAAAVAKARVDWVDYAKGICIILVVLMHSTLGVEKAAGQVTWIHPFIDWARPFRMPDFFLISGLFLAQRIDRPWREYLDSKVLHFVYFYVVWMTIIFFAKSGVLTGGIGPLEGLAVWASSLYLPNDAIWFIYMLPVFMLVIKLAKPLPPVLIFAGAAVLEALHIKTGYLVIDEFAMRFVYVFAGYWLSTHIFAFARFVGAQPLLSVLAGFFAWALVNTLAVVSGHAALPGVSLALGFLGACAVVTAGVLLSKTSVAEALRYCGENSIVIYLAFSLFMSATRIILLRLGQPADLGLVSLICTTAGVTGPLLLFWTVRGTPLKFLFKRPSWAKLTQHQTVT